MLVAAAFLALTLASVSEGSHWNYKEQDLWPETCKGKRQSPINIEDICFPLGSTRLNSSLKVTLLNYDKAFPANLFTLTNNGHTSELALNGSTTVNASYPRITGSAADNDVFQFTALHFHWHQKDNHGAEHSVHGIRQALEMHMVHWNTKYGTKDAAAAQVDGLIVIGVLFQENGEENKHIEPITNLLNKVRKIESSVQLGSPLKLASLVPPTYETFYKYPGSLTTPPCSETVRFLIVQHVQPLSLRQLTGFRSLNNMQNEPLGDTNRELQDMNNRTVEASSNAHCKRPRQG